MFVAGDSGFPLEPWLITPFSTTVAGTPEHAFNEKFLKARKVIERCFGVLKMRFRCLLKHRVLHYSPQRAANIIYAVLCLHNICIENGLSLFEDDSDSDDDESSSGSQSDNDDSSDDDDVPRSRRVSRINWLRLGQRVRQRYIEQTINM